MIYPPPLPPPTLWDLTWDPMLILWLYFNMGFWVYGSLTWVSMLTYGKIGLYFNMGNANPMGPKPYGDLTWDSGSMGI